MKRQNKILSFVISALVTAAPSAVLADAGINIGDYVQMGTYNDAPVLWRCIDIDENGPLMLSDEILSLRAFDASGDVQTGSHSRGAEGYRKLAGSNYWADSNIRAWLNSDALSGNIVWECGNSPVSGEVTRFQNAYDGEAGFLRSFTLSERKLIKEVTQKAILDKKEYADMSGYGAAPFTYNISISDIMQNYDVAYSENVTDKVFLLDVAQLDSLVTNLGNDYAKGIISEGCLAYTDTFKENGLELNAAWSWWLRTPVTEDVCHSVYVRYVMDNGTEAGLDYAKQTDKGIRPAFYLDSENSFTISGTGEKNAPYVLKMASSAISEYGATVAKFNNNIVNVSGKVDASLAGKNVTVVLAPKATYNTLLTAKHVTNATVSEDGSYTAKFKAVISEDDVLIVKAGGSDTVYSLAAPREKSDKLVELDVDIDENKKANVSLVNKFIDATEAKLIIAEFADGRFNTAEVVDYELAFGPDGEIQKYVSEKAVEGREVRVYLWKSFNDLVPLSNAAAETVENAE